MGTATLAPPTATDLFESAFTAELETKPPDTDWIVSGRPSKAHPHGEDEGWWRDEGPAMVQRWIDWRSQSPWQIWVAPDGQPGIELAVYETVGDGGPVKMFVDRVFSTDGANGRPVVVDLKSGSREPDNDQQLGLYKVGLELMYPGIRIFGGAYWMARSGKMGGLFSLSWATPDYYGALFRRLRLARQSAVFLPNRSALCKTCKVGTFCAANNGANSHMDPDFVLMGG